MQPAANTTMTRCDASPLDRPHTSSGPPSAEATPLAAGTALSLLTDKEVVQLRDSLLVKRIYTGLCRLGEGKHGTVYKFQAERGAVAIKRSKIGSSDKILSVWNGSYAQLQREYDLGQKLQHPAFVRHDSLETYHSPCGTRHAFLCMEFLTESSLLSVLPRLTLCDLAAIAEQVGQAAIYATQHGVVPLDLSLTNVLVGENNKVRIIDFGMYQCLNEGSIGSLWEALLWQQRYVDEWMTRHNPSNPENRSLIGDWLKATWSALYGELRLFLASHPCDEVLCLTRTAEAQRGLTSDLWVLARQVDGADGEARRVA